MYLLILGGSGTISHGLAKEAVNRGHDVTVINRGSRKYRIISGVKVVIGDINDTEKIKEFLGDRVYDVIVDPLVFDVRGLRKHIQLFGIHCKKYVLISSCCAFGCTDGLEAIDEAHPMKPESKYGIGKQACEAYLRENSFDFDYTILRPYITYGDIRIPIPFSCRINPYTVIERIEANKPLVCFRFTGDNRTFHNLMDISDFSKVAISVIENASSANNDYNICSRNVYEWDDAYRLLYKKLDKERHVYEVDQRAFKRLDNHLWEDILYDKNHTGAVYSGEKAFLLTREQSIQEISLENGISRLVDYLKANLKKEPAEKYFNRRTDMLLLFAVKAKDGFLKNYLHNLGICYKSRLFVTWHLLPYKNAIIAVKKKLKKIIH